ncbi:MAG: pirin family protein [Saprospiraceae bacterium]|nr:pirin family protein [Saprospiraceae bacterium]
MSNKIIAVTALGFPWKTIDPFLFCAYHKDDYPAGNDHFGPVAPLDGHHIGQDFDPSLPWRMYHGSTVPGFPQHPHRGFETVTIAKTGLVDHSDSLGAAGRFGDGDVQWMTAGRGVLHAEMFPLLRQDRENPLELFQIWLNLPKKNKMVEPHFKMLWRDSIPTIVHNDANDLKTTIDLIAGNIEDQNAPKPTPNSWAADAANHVAIWTIEMDPKAQWILPASHESAKRALYFYKGANLEIDGIEVKANNRIEILSNQELKIQNGHTRSYLLMLQGRSINEPVAQHGPFVMNTQAEIQDAFAEFRRTQFGGWPWPKNDQVHDRAKGRFAVHADGMLEEK